MRARLLPALLLAALALAGCAAPEDTPGAGTATSTSAATSDTSTTVAAQAPATCPGHWHVSFDLYVNGTRVSYDHAAYTLEGRQGMPVATHLHRGNDWQWHFEPAERRCIPLASALAHVDTWLAPDRLVLNGTHAELGRAGTYQAGEGAVLEARHRAADGQWTAIPIAGLVDRQPAGGERIVVAFGPPGDADWDAWQSAADARSLQPSR